MASLKSCPEPLTPNPINQLALQLKAQYLHYPESYPGKNYYRTLATLTAQITLHEETSPINLISRHTDLSPAASPPSKVGHSISLKAEGRQRQFEGLQAVEGKRTQGWMRD